MASKLNINKNELTYIFEFLSIKDIGRCCSVSKQFNNAGSSDLLWKRIFKKEHGEVMDEEEKEKEKLNMTWKQFYREFQWHWDFSRSKYEGITLSENNRTIEMINHTSTNYTVLGDKIFHPDRIYYFSLKLISVSTLRIGLVCEEFDIFEASTSYALGNTTEQSNNSKAFGFIPSGGYYIMKEAMPSIQHSSDSAPLFNKKGNTIHLKVDLIENKLSCIVVDDSNLDDAKEHLIFFDIPKAKYYPAVSLYGRNNAIQLLPSYESEYRKRNKYH